MKVKSFLNGAINDVLRETSGLHVDIYPHTEVITVERGIKKPIVIDTQTGSFGYSRVDLLAKNQQVVNGRSVVKCDVAGHITTTPLACLAGVAQFILDNKMTEWDCMYGYHVNHMDGCGNENVAGHKNDRLYNLELVSANEDEIHIGALRRLNDIYEGNRKFAISATDKELVNFIKYHTPLEVMAFVKKQEIEKDNRGYEYIGQAALKLREWKQKWSEIETDRLIKEAGLKEVRS